MSHSLPPREQLVGQLYTAVLSDVLDALRQREQAMRPFIRPSTRTASCSGGRAPAST